VVRRVNRFKVEVLLDGVVPAYLPNSGRMRELIYPGALGYVSEASRTKGKTRYDLLLVRHRGLLVSVDSRLPNILVSHALRQHCLPELGQATILKQEARWGESRFDFALHWGRQQGLLEVKSVTKVVNGVGRFPDAVTARGDRHLRQLMEAVHLGIRAIVIFVVQRPDAEAFGPDWEADPTFSATLTEAAAAGVEIYARKCQVSLHQVQLDAPIPLAM
jgi:sugar fermentation stimulation protein A